MSQDGEYTKHPDAAAVAIAYFEEHDVDHDLVFSSDETYENAHIAAGCQNRDGSSQREVQHYSEALVNSFPRVMTRVKGMKRVVAQEHELSPKTRVVPAFVWTSDAIKCNSARGRTLLVSIKCKDKKTDTWICAACLWCRDMRIGCDITDVRLVLRGDAEDILPAHKKRKRVAIDDDRYQREDSIPVRGGLATPSASPNFTTAVTARAPTARASSSRAPKNAGYEAQALKDRVASKDEIIKVLIKANEDKDKHLGDKEKIIAAVTSENTALKAHIAHLEAHGGGKAAAGSKAPTLRMPAPAASTASNNDLAKLVTGLDARVTKLTDRVTQLEAKATETATAIKGHTKTLKVHGDDLAANQDQYKWIVANCSDSPYVQDDHGRWVPAEGGSP